MRHFRVLAITLLLFTVTPFAQNYSRQSYPTFPGTEFAYNWGQRIDRADFNRDGRPDIFVVTQTGFAVLLNQGNGIFAPAVLTPVANIGDAQVGDCRLIPLRFAIGRECEDVTKAERLKVNKRIVAVAVFGLLVCGVMAVAQDHARPEFIGGKHYSLQECERIAKWVTGDGFDELNRLTGIELGNLWYTLDNCVADDEIKRDTGQRYEPKSKRALAERNNLVDALDFATDSYIRALERAIMNLPEHPRGQALDALKQKGMGDVSHPVLPPWSPFAVECAAADADHGTRQQALDPQAKRALERCLAAMEKQHK